MSQWIKILWDTGRHTWSKRWVRRTASLLTSLLVLAFLVLYASKSIGELRQIKDNLRLPVLFATFPIFLGLTYCAGFMWSKIIRLFNQELPDQLNIYIYLLTLAARRLPGSLLHVVGRTALYKKKGLGVRIQAFASALEVALILWAGILVGLTAWLLSYRIEVSQVWVMGAAFLFITVLIHPKTLRFFLQKLTKEPEPPFIRYSSLLKLLTGYIFIWLAGGTMLFVFIEALYPVSISLWIPVLIAWSLYGVSGQIITILPAGLGVSEIALSLVLGQFIPPSVAVSVAILSRILLTFYDFTVSLALMAYGKQNNPYGLL